MKYRTDSILGEAFCISLLLFFHFPDSVLSVLTGLNIYFFIIDGVTMKTAETQQCISELPITSKGSSYSLILFDWQR